MGWLSQSEHSKNPLLNSALFDPASMFASPGDVLHARDFTTAEKAAILRSWEYDAAERAVAEEEGMQGDDNDLLRHILLALGQLTGYVNADRVAPTKQHGLVS